MIEKQPTHKQLIKSPTAKTYSLIGCFSILFLLMIIPSALATTSSDVTILSPVINQKFNTNSIGISGTFTSPDNPPNISISIDQNSYGASVGNIVSLGDGYKGTWAVSVGTSNGWHTVKAIISDSNGVTSDTVQFYTNDGSAIISQIKFKEIPVEYSQACLAMINQGDYSSCPPMEKLIPVDTSNQAVSGHFVQGKYGMVREKPQMRNAQEFYDKSTVCVGCYIDGNSDSQMQIIWIVPHLFSYSLHDFTTSTINDTSGSGTYHISTVNEQNAGLTVYHDKYVDDSCMSAQVVYKDANTLPDTIKYLEGNCVDKSYFNTTQTIVPNTPFSFDNPYSSLYYKAVTDKVKAEHPGLCMDDKCGLTTSTRKAGY